MIARQRAAIVSTASSQEIRLTMDHIGIDVHKRESRICMLAEGGELIEPRSSTEPERFVEVFGKRPRFSLATVELEPARAGARLIFTEPATFLDGYNDLGEREKGTRAGLDSLDAELKREPRVPDGSWPSMSIS